MNDQPTVGFDFDKYAAEMEAMAEPLRHERRQKAAELDELDEQLRRLDTAIRALNGQLPKLPLYKSNGRAREGVNDQTREAILKALRENGPEVQQSDIARFAGVSKSTTARGLHILLDEGQVRRIQPASGQNPAIWELIH